MPHIAHPIYRAHRTPRPPRGHPCTPARGHPCPVYRGGTHALEDPYGIGKGPPIAVPSPKRSNNTRPAARPHTQTADSKHHIHHDDLSIYNENHQGDDGQNDRSTAKRLSVAALPAVGNGTPDHAHGPKPALPAATGGHPARIGPPAPSFATTFATSSRRTSSPEAADPYTARGSSRPADAGPVVPKTIRDRDHGHEVLGLGDRDHDHEHDHERGAR